MRIRLRGKVLSKYDILDNPEEYRGKNILCFEVSAVGKLKKYLGEANTDRQTLLLTDWPRDPVSQQIALFFALRDRLAEHWFPGRIISRKEKDETYRAIVGQMDIIDENMDEVQSLKGLDSAEMSGLIDSLKDWLWSEGVDITELA